MNKTELNETFEEKHRLFKQLKDANSEEGNKGMEDIKNQDIPAEVSIYQKEFEQTEELLKAENETYKAQISKASAEIDEVDRTLLSAKDYIASCEKRIKEYPDKIEKLKLRNESLLAEVNNIKLKIKSSREDEESTLLLRDTLIEEHENLKNEKAVLVRRINKMEKAVEEISSEREQKLPKLKKYDEMLKEAWNVFYETESRMEVSLKLWHGKTAHKLENT